MHAHDSDGKSREYLLEAGQGFLICPGQICMYIADAEDPWAYLGVEFDGLCVPEYLQRTSLTKDAPIYTAKTEETRNRMEAELTWICQNPEAHPLHTIAHLYHFLGYLIDSAPGSRASGGSHIRDRYIRIALEYIEKNYSRKIRVEDIASECGIDRSYFGKIFHHAIGQSPQSFLLHYRMMRACTMLQETDMTVAAVGAAVGYDNALHFSRAFKNLYGSSPREWRVRNRLAAAQKDSP